MKKFLLQIVGLLVLIFGGIFLTFNSSIFNPFIKNIPSPFAGNSTNTSSPTQTTGKIKILSSDGATVKSELSLEIADTAQSRAQGLSGRTALDQNSGMLFVFDKPDIYRFWMKGMVIPLDFIWIADNQIKDILVNVPPPDASSTDQVLPVYSPTVPVDRVLEVNSGYANSHGLAVGDKIVSE